MPTNNSWNSQNPAQVAKGGTGVATMTTAYAPVCAGTTATGNLQVASTGLATSGYVLTSNGSSALPSFQAATAPGTFSQVVIQTFASSGTYTPTSNMKYCIIEILGSGGGGGGASAPGNFSGTGGGAGEYARGVFSAATIGASKAITINAGGSGGVGAVAGSAGGTNSVGALITAVGGAAAVYPTIQLEGVPQVGGSGGTGGSGGDFRCPGMTAQSSQNMTTSGGNPPTPGANSQYGGGGQVANHANGSNGVGYGAGGGGASPPSSNGNTTGGAGSSGIVIITEYI